MNSKQFVAGLGNGWNLGNTLDATAKNPNATVQDHETAWRNPVTTREMIQLLADTGLSVLRVPVTYERRVGPGPSFTINPEWLARVREVVSYGIDAGLYVITNLHHEEWHYPSEENAAAAEAQLIAMWKQLAETFEDFSQKLIFEGMNEPRMKGMPEEWTGGTPEARAVINRWNAAFVKTIRESGGNNRERYLMIPGSAAGNFEEVLTDIVVPNDDKVIISVHSYTPYEFALKNDMEANRWDEANPADTCEIDALFERMDRIFLKKGIPVILGEFGAQNKNGNTEDRVRWLRYFTAKAKEYGVPCVWWDNGYIEKDGDEFFGIMDRENACWAFPEFAQILSQLT